MISSRTRTSTSTTRRGTKKPDPLWDRVIALTGVEEGFAFSPDSLIRSHSQPLMPAWLFLLNGASCLPFLERQHGAGREDGGPSVLRVDVYGPVRANLRVHRLFHVIRLRVWITLPNDLERLLRPLVPFGPEVATVLLAGDTKHGWLEMESREGNGSGEGPRHPTRYREDIARFWRVATFRIRRFGSAG